MLTPKGGVEGRSDAPQLRLERLAGTQGRLMSNRPRGSFLLAYMEDAIGGYAIDGHHLEPGEADLVFLRPAHTIEPNGLRVGTGAVIAFRADAVESRRPDEKSALPLLGDPRWPWGADASERRVTVPRNERTLWTSRIDLLEWEIEYQQTGCQQAIRAHLTALLIGAARLGTRADGGGPPATDPVMHEVLEVIENGYSGHLSLEGVAREVGRSPRHLSRLIRNLTGKTVMDWIDERRMEEARRLLLESDHTVETIAQRVGYHDTGYFRRRFRRAHGLSPAAWRRGNAY